MDGSIVGKIISKSLFDGFVQAMQIAWTLDEFKSAIIGIPVSLISFKIVGQIFKWGRDNEIWFGSIGGKIIYYLILTLLVWVILKLL